VHLTVIIPTLNRLETASLLAGRIRELLPALEIEVIVVTPAAGEEPTSNEFVRYVADAGRGVYMAYDAGLRSARGEYVWFMGDDDYPLDAVTRVSGMLQEGAVDVLIAPVLF
jgi:glycosyltransferase involved in cell wall biosynthesis